MRILVRFLVFVAVLAAVTAGYFVWFGMSTLHGPPEGVVIPVKPGANLRTVGRQLADSRAIIDAQSFRVSDEPLYSEKSIHKAISNALKQARIIYPALALSTVNRFRQFALVLFSATSEDLAISVGQYQVFYEKLSAELANEALTCYIGNWIAYEHVRDEVKQMHVYIDENISNRTGVYLTSGQDIAATAGTNLAESTERWRTLISGGQKRMLEHEIEAYLESTVATSKNKLKSLCDLHQQLTHIFFGFFYDSNADMSKLFNEKYTYADYMNGFKDTDSLRKAVSFMLNAIDDIQKDSVSKSDIEIAKSFIANNISNPITVKDVADHVNLSAEYFTKLFKQPVRQLDGFFAADDGQFVAASVQRQAKLAFDDAKMPVGLSIQRSSDGVIGERELFANQTTAVVAARFTMKVFCHSGLKKKAKA